MSFSLSELPTEIGVKELAPEEAVEILVAQIVQGKVAAGNQSGFDVYKSELFPGKTFQVKFAHTWLRPGKTAKVDGYTRVFKDSPAWAFRVGNANHIADWYVLFGESGGLIYPFLLSYEEWRQRSVLMRRTRYLSITAKEYSRSGKGYKRNRTWEYYIRDWPAGLLLALETIRSSDQLKMAI